MYFALLRFRSCHWPFIWISGMRISLQLNVSQILTLSWPRSLSYRNQSTNMQSKFLYDRKSWASFYMIGTSIMKELRVNWTRKLINVNYARIHWSIFSLYPMNTGRRLNVHKRFRRRPERLLNVLFTFNLRSMSRV